MHTTINYNFISTLNTSQTIKGANQSYLSDKICQHVFMYGFYFMNIQSIDIAHS